MSNITHIITPHLISEPSSQQCRRTIDIDASSGAYAALSGLPIRDYQAAVELDRQEGTMLIHWHASFVPKVPGTGWILERGIRRFLSQCSHGLAEYAASSRRVRPIDQS